MCYNAVHAPNTKMTQNPSSISDTKYSDEQTLPFYYTFQAFSAKNTQPPTATGEPATHYSCCEALWQNCTFLCRDEKSRSVSQSSEFCLIS